MRLIGQRSWVSVVLAGAIIATVLRVVPYVVDMHHAVAFPATADALWFVAPPTDPAGMAPLQITAPSDDGGINFAVRLDDWNSGRPVVVVPIRAGDTAEVSVPLGSYALTIARGRAWQGPERFFGHTGDVRKGSELMAFYRSGAGSMGHTIDLTDRPNGNLPMRPEFFGR